MKKRQIAVIGLGRLGQRCAELLLDDPTLGLAGVVRRTPAPLDWLGDLPVVGHFTELKQVDAALLCVPTDSVQGQARELLQHRIPLVECARLHGDAFIAHHGEMQRMAHLYRTTAIVGAGSDPGILSLFRSQFALLLPHGHTRSSLHAPAPACTTRWRRKASRACAGRWRWRWSRGPRMARCSATSTSSWSRVPTRPPRVLWGDQGAAEEQEWM